MDPALGHNSASRLIAFGLNDGAGVSITIVRALSIDVGAGGTQALQTSTATVISVDVASEQVSGEGSGS
jgi:Fe2+ transport system protein FeoA